ncbi:hypothetical protein P43SY_009517 [Pythium insidiosum]|uniref:EF-hand domain-containing protein n=1 Tax=Pythium insidiosum TaxID=114742 RepID=A0AAD5Q6K0_PYTIN|nr:hypothetical protein P43SY_009517 [Pythium insidiosum]
MPATEVSPSLRRRLSDDARQILRSALGHGENSSDDLTKLSLGDRLKNFRGKIRLEVPGLDSAIRLRIVVTDVSYLLRYHFEDIGAEVSIVNKSGATTSWITTAHGHNVQLRVFLSDITTPERDRTKITTLMDILETMDLFDAFRSSLGATEMASDRMATHRIYSSTGERHDYLFVVDRATGKPLALTQTPLTSSPQSVDRLHLLVEDYLRYEGGVEVPAGIKSDVELMIDTAINCFAQWSLAGQQRVINIFEAMDKDCDGFVSGRDVFDQLLSVGHKQQQCINIVTEMSRLVCDTSDPAEEIPFFKFCGFWVTMLADHYRVSDPANEDTVLTSFEKLFLGL